MVICVCGRELLWILQKMRKRVQKIEISLKILLDFECGYAKSFKMGDAMRDVARQARRDDDVGIILPSKHVSNTIQGLLTLRFIHRINLPNHCC